MWNKTAKFGRIARGEERISSGSATPLSKGTGPQRFPIFGGSLIEFCGFSATYAYTVWPRTTKFWVVTHAEGTLLGGQPRHCICTNTSRGLSATAEFLVYFICNQTNHVDLNVPFMTVLLCWNGVPPILKSVELQKLRSLLPLSFLSPKAWLAMMSSVITVISLCIEDCQVTRWCCVDNCSAGHRSDARLFPMLPH